MTVLLPVASGKGGVGKTVLVANLGIALASRGKTVVVVDLDLGASNLHTALGIRNRSPGIGNMIYRQEERLEALLVPTEVPRLHFIPGDCLIPGTANLSFFTKQKIIRNLRRLIADYVLVDLGAGSAFNTVDLFLSSAIGVVVITPETTSILNAYGFLKTAAFRLLVRSFQPDSRERQTVVRFLTSRLEGTDRSLPQLVEELRQLDAAAGELAVRRLQEFYPRVVLNMGRGQRDLQIGLRLRSIVTKNLAIPLEYIGFLKQDEQVHRSVDQRRPCLLLSPAGPFSRSVQQLAERILLLPDTPSPSLYEGDEDLLSLQAGNQG